MLTVINLFFNIKRYLNKYVILFTNI